MPKYLITWNAGYGNNYEVAESETLTIAKLLAYENWREEVEESAEYNAVLLTEQLAEDYGFEDELDSKPKN